MRQYHNCENLMHIVATALKNATLVYYRIQWGNMPRLTALIIFWQNTLPANIRKLVFSWNERDGITSLHGIHVWSYLSKCCFASSERVLKSSDCDIERKENSSWPFNFWILIFCFSLIFQSYCFMKCTIQSAWIKLP